MTQQRPYTGQHRTDAAEHRRRSRMYMCIVAGWLVLCIGLARAVYPVITDAFHRNAAIGAATVLVMVFIAYFWLNGIKDVVYPIVYRMTPWRRQSAPLSSRYRGALVGLLYVTYNDFSVDALTRSLQQDHAYCRPVILDDSSDPAYRAQIDVYAAAHGVEVVRRAGRKGYKAGNLNHYLNSEAGRELDYFVIIDSDEILPAGFVTRALDYFAANARAGIVQANHIATRNRTTFMRTFAPGVDAHWPAYQTVKTHAGFLSLLGHGAMVSLESYQAAGGFPEIVAEDLGFSIEAAAVGWTTVFAGDITCEEEFPPDYAAFKKRHRKWTEGNMEFLRRYSKRILLTRTLPWYQRMDIVLFTYGLPLTGLFSIFVIANAVVFPMLGFAIRFPLWMIVPTVAFLFAPMINDVLTWRAAPKRELVTYLLQSVALFGSMYFVSLFASLRTMTRSSVFHVTPKNAGSSDFTSAVRENSSELAAAGILTIAVELTAGSILPVMLLVVPTIFSVYLSVLNHGDTSTDQRHILMPAVTGHEREGLNHVRLPVRHHGLDHHGLGHAGRLRARLHVADNQAAAAGQGTLVTRRRVAWAICLMLLVVTCGTSLIALNQIQQADRSIRMLVADSMDSRLTQLVSAKVTGLPALGAGFTISINGNDAVGQINIETGASPVLGDMFHVTFNTPYTEADVQPFVFIQPIDQPPISGLYCTIDWFGFDCIATALLKPHTNYPLAYFVASRPWAMYLQSRLG